MVGTSFHVTTETARNFLWYIVGLVLIFCGFYCLKLKLLSLHYKAKKKVDLCVEQAKTLLRSQSSDDVEAAVNTLDLAIEESPPWLDPPLVELKARALMRLHRYSAIVDLLQDYLPEIDRRLNICTNYHGYRKNGEVLQPDEFWKIVFLGQSCYHLGRLDEALALLQRAKWQSRMASQVYSLGHPMSSRSSPAAEDNFDGSDPSGLPLEALNRLIAIIKFLVRRRAAGEAAFATKMYYEAVRQYSRVLDSKKAPPQTLASSLYLDRASAYEKLNKFPDAIADCTRASALNPECPHAIWRRSLLYRVLNCPAESAEDIKMLIDMMQNQGLSPRSPRSPMAPKLVSQLCWAFLRRLMREYVGFQKDKGARILAQWAQGGAKGRGFVQSLSPGKVYSLALPSSVAELEMYLRHLDEEVTKKKNSGIDYIRALDLLVSSSKGPEARVQGNSFGLKDPSVAFRVASLRQDPQRSAGFLERWVSNGVRAPVEKENMRLKKVLESAFKEALVVCEEQGGVGSIQEGSKVLAEVKAAEASSLEQDRPQGLNKRSWRFRRRSRPLSLKSHKILLEERVPVGLQFDSLLMWMRVEKPVGGGLLDEPDLGVVGSLEDLPLQSVNPEPLEDSGGGAVGFGKQAGRLVVKGLKGVLGLGLIGGGGGGGPGVGGGVGGSGVGGRLEGSEGKGKVKEKGRDRDKEKKVAKKEKGLKKDRNKATEVEWKEGVDVEREEKGKARERGRQRWRGGKFLYRDAEDGLSLSAGDGANGSAPPVGSDDEAERWKKLTRRVGIIAHLGKVPRKPRQENGAEETKGVSKGKTIWDPKGGPKGDHKGDSEGDPKVDPKGDPKVDPKGDPEGDPKWDPEVDPKWDPKVVISQEVKGEMKAESGFKEGHAHKHISKKILEFGQRSISPLRRPRRPFTPVEEKVSKLGKRGTTLLAKTDSEEAVTPIPSPCPPSPECSVGAVVGGTSPLTSSPSEASSSPLSLSEPSSPSRMTMSAPLLPIEDLQVDKVSPRGLPRFLFPRTRSRSLEAVLAPGQGVEINGFHPGRSPING